MARGRKVGSVTWQGSCAGASIAAGSSLLSVINIPSSSSTLLRTRGEVVASIDGPTDGDKTCVGMGLIVVTEEQTTVGVSAVPNPLSDLDAEWIWHGFLLLMAQGATEDSNVVTNAVRLTVDSKAMRKIKQTQDIVLITGLANQAGTPAVDIMFGIRQLFGFV